MIFIVLIHSHVEEFIRPSNKVDVIFNQIFYLFFNNTCLFIIHFLTVESEKKHRHHRKHKHKKHKKHRRSKDTNDGPEDSDQDVGLQQIDYSIPHMDGIVGDDDINIGDPSQSTFILDGEHCDVMKLIFLLLFGCLIFNF